ncbi:MAG: tetratricopeptide repeat protein [Proteobacteria bacterium]|nr:tetratricopeptide repeat protein [Pseudomonadota bacterium]
MKTVSKLIFLLFVLLILTYPVSVRAIPVQVEGLPKPDELVLKADKDISYSVWVAGQYLKAGKFKEVVIICERVLAVKQSHIQALAHLAAAHRGLGNEEIFQREASLIRKLNPESPALYLSLAATYTALNDLKSAEGSYQQGLKTAADKTQLRMGLAALYLEKGRLKEASDQYLEVLKKKNLEPKHFLNANFALCRIGLQQKEYDKVIKRAGMVTDLYPPIPQGYLFLGSACLGKGKTDEAINAYKKLLKINPKSPVSYQELALIYTDKLSDYQNALYYAKEVARKFPKDAKSQDVLGWVHYQNGKYLSALTQFKTAVRLEEKNPQYYYHLGLVHQKMGNKAMAKDAFRQALGLVGSGGSKAFAEELKKLIGQCN